MHESRSRGSPNTAYVVPGPERTLMLRTSSWTLIHNFTVLKVCFVGGTVDVSLVGVMVVSTVLVGDEVAVGARAWRMMLATWQA